MEYHCYNLAVPLRTRMHVRRIAMATISRLLKIIGPFCRISSLSQGSFAKETYNFKEPTSRSHPIARMPVRRIAWIHCYAALATLCNTLQHVYSKGTRDDLDIFFWQYKSHSMCSVSLLKKGMNKTVGTWKNKQAVLRIDFLNLDVGRRITVPEASYWRKTSWALSAHISAQEPSDSSKEPSYFRKRALYSIQKVPSTSSNDQSNSLCPISLCGGND